MMHAERLTAQLDGEFVVFLIGMRLNKPWKIHKWLPVAMAMPRMLKELDAAPEAGLLGREEWIGRTTIMVQYWRSMDHLFAYAQNRDAEHFPAWKAFYKAIGTSGDVGIWHETYLVTPGSYENIYVNMPAFGLGKVGKRVPASGGKQTALGRIGKR